MTSSIGDIFRKARPAINSLMTGLCTVQEYQSVVNAETHVTSQQLVTIYQDQPCRLSYIKASATEEGDSPTSLLTVKIFISPELNIRAGSIIEVVQAGKTEKYKASSHSAMYINHQEIELERFHEYV